jgi:hypothetical protein
MGLFHQRPIFKEWIRYLLDLLAIVAVRRSHYFSYYSGENPENDPLGVENL